MGGNTVISYSTLLYFTMLCSQFFLQRLLPMFLFWACTLEISEAGNNWPTASSRIGQDIELACESDLEIAQYWHSESGFRCQTQLSLGITSTPIPCELNDTCGGCYDYMLLGCNCGAGLWHCPSGWRVVRYYSCDPLDPVFIDRVKTAYDGTHVFLAAAAQPVNCSSSKPAPVVDDGDSYGNDDYNVGGGGSGGDGSGGGSGGDGSGGGSGGDGSGGGSGGDGSGGGSGGDGSGDSVDPNDYECAQSPGGSTDSSVAYQNCYSSLANIYETNGVHKWCGSGTHNIDGSGGSSTCDTYGDGSCCNTSYREGCSCSSVSGVSAYYAYCSSYSGCGLPGQKVSCYDFLGKFPYGVFVQCSLEIPKPDGSGNWTDSWTMPEAEGCNSSCDLHRQNYSDEFPDSGGSGPDDPEDYEDCAASPNCRWVGAPMGFGVCHCDGDSGSAGDEGTGPTNSRNSDSDGDGQPDYEDSDDDGDGIPDNLDSDDDGDGIPDEEEVKGGDGKCGVGVSGTNCEATQQKILETLSETGERVENISQMLSKKPSDSAKNSINSAKTQFESDLSNSNFLDSVFSAPEIQAQKQNFFQILSDSKTEISSAISTISISVPAGAGIDYGCIQFQFQGVQVGPECVSTYLRPAVPMLHQFMEFFKYILGFLILFRK